MGNQQPNCLTFSIYACKAKIVKRLLKGVTVTQEEGRLVIALHIKVGYGLNISTITQSITHRVKDEVEHATGLKVARINVFVDDIIAD